ncbi:MAG: DsbA family protein [Alphaproteobacteria bacterium]|nr:DsbA family protein [Alphaproteobacteria bacterium]
MTINTSWIVGGLILLLALAGGLFWLSGPSTPPQAAEAKVATKEAPPVAAETQPAACVEKGTFEVATDDFVVGDAKAPITLVEFFSQTCSHCAEFHKEAFPKLNETYIKKGLVRLVLRDFQRNQVDVAASVVGRCLGREGFVKFTDSLLERQAEWLERPDQDIRLGLKEMAKRAGLADKEFEACMKQEDQAKQLLAKSMQAQKDYCIEGTPTLLLNGKKIENATTFDELDAYIQAEIKKQAMKSDKPPAKP